MIVQIGWVLMFGYLYFYCFFEIELFFFVFVVQDSEVRFYVGEFVVLIVSVGAKCGVFVVPYDHFVFSISGVKITFGTAYVVGRTSCVLACQFIYS